MRTLRELLDDFNDPSFEPLVCAIESWAYGEEGYRDPLVTGKFHGTREPGLVERLSQNAAFFCDFSDEHRAEVARALRQELGGRK